MSEPVVTPAAEPAADFAAFEARENAVALGETPAAEPTPEPVTDPDSDDEPEPEPEAEPAPAKDAAPVVAEPVKISKRQKYINELQAKATAAETARAEADRRAAELEAKLAARTSTPEPAAKPAVADEFQPTKPKPAEADFDTYADFTEALTDWKLEQREAKAAFDSAKTQREQAATAQAESDRARIGGWVSRRDAFFAKHPSKADTVSAFLATVTSGTPIGDTIIDSEVGGELADYLATHKDEADRIARLSPRSALLALGKLTATFDSPTNASAPAQPAAKTVTTAPAVPHTLAARSADPADPVKAAVERGDYLAFEAEANRLAAV